MLYHHYTLNEDAGAKGWLMKLRILGDKQETGRAAGRAAAARLREAIQERGRASLIVATGASQFETLAALVNEPDVRWDQVTCFHLDEYIGLPIIHGASFRRYLWERFVRRLPLPLAAFHYLHGDAPDPAAECRRVGSIIHYHSVDVALVGIGENAHLAFNDPPADFTTEDPYIVVKLDEGCRRQQLGEGWFSSLAEVPTRAISMSVQQILKSRSIICSVPDQRKADAVKAVLEGPITNTAPASILRTHDDCTLLIDQAAASRLARSLLEKTAGGFSSTANR
jgi:glucosamine-6-phosphate deaminase